jgi:hypothetical protein
VSQPETLWKAVEAVLDGLSEKGGQLEIFRDYREEELCLLHHGLGRAIRNKFGLWGDNTALINDLTKRAGEMDADGMSSIIIITAWQEVNATNCVIIEGEEECKS